MQSGKIYLTPQQKKEKHAEAQRRYIEKQKIRGNDDCLNQINLLNAQLNEKNTFILQLQQQTSKQNESLNTIANLNEQIKELKQRITFLTSANNSKDYTISQLLIKENDLKSQINNNLSDFENKTLQSKARFYLAKSKSQ